MNEILETIFGLAGGLALFLFGMNSMSDALQKVAGEKMKQILGFLTRNRVMGAVAGALVTAVLQSSSATTVMVIGFVSAGLMTLPQGISVIFGANIGTTMTAQLLAFKISDYIYPIIFIGFIIYFVSKNEKVKNVGMVIFSFGLLFEGIEIMGSVMKPLASSAFFVNAMGVVADIPVLGVLLGALMTLIAQSSSATIAILQNFASQAAEDGVTSILGLAGAIPILLGDNIGTTITALLASIGQSKDARRTAVAHSVFNISGSVVFLFLLKPFTAFVEWLTQVVMGITGAEVDIISREIANAHTCFNIACTIVWLFLLPLMVKIVKAIIPGDEEVQTEEISAEPRYLNDKILVQPAAAMYLVTKELTSTSNDTQVILNTTREEVAGKDLDKAKANFDQQYNAIQSIQTQTSQYITKLFSSGTLTEQQSEQTAELFYVSNNLQRISRRCGDITQIMRGMRENNKSLSEYATQELQECFDILIDTFSHAASAVETGNADEAKAVTADQLKLRKAEKKFNKAHLKRVKNGLCDASLTEDFSDILYNMDRIADNCSSIAEEVLDEFNFKNLEIPDESVEQIEKEIDETKATTTKK